MKTTLKALFAAGFAGVVLVGCATHHGNSCCSSSGDKKCAMKTEEYEYKTVIAQASSDAKLNEAAKGGWDLVAVSPNENSGGSKEYIFERLKQ